MHLVATKVNFAALLALTLAGKDLKVLVILPLAEKTATREEGELALITIALLVSLYLDKRKALCCL